MFGLIDTPPWRCSEALRAWAFCSSVAPWVCAWANWEVALRSCSRNGGQLVLAHAGLLLRLGQLRYTASWLSRSMLRGAVLKLLVLRA